MMSIKTNMPDRIFIFITAFFITLALSTVTAKAAEDITSHMINESKEMTEGELAVILVNSMGIESKLPIAPMSDDYISILDSDGIRPLSGWVAEKTLTTGVFAEIMACAIGVNTRLISPIEICNEERGHIQKMWDAQYKQDGRHESLEKLLQDKRFFPNGPPMNPYGYEYTDKNGAYTVDPIVIAPDRKILNPAVQSMYTLKKMGIEIEGDPAVVLTGKAVKGLLQSPIFRSALPHAVINVPLTEQEKEKAGQHVTPVTPIGG